MMKKIKGTQTELHNIIDTLEIVRNELVDQVKNIIEPLFGKYIKVEAPELASTRDVNLVANKIPNYKTVVWENCGCPISLRCKSLDCRGVPLCTIIKNFFDDNGINTYVYVPGYVNYDDAKKIKEKLKRASFEASEDSTENDLEDEFDNSGCIKEIQLTYLKAKRLEEPIKNVRKTVVKKLNLMLGKVFKGYIQVKGWGPGNGEYLYLDSTCIDANTDTRVVWPNRDEILMSGFNSSENGTVHLGHLIIGFFHKKGISIDNKIEVYVNERDAEKIINALQTEAFEETSKTEENKKDRILTVSINLSETGIDEEKEEGDLTKVLEQVKSVAQCYRHSDETQKGYLGNCDSLSGTFKLDPALETRSKYTISFEASEDNVCEERAYSLEEALDGFSRNEFVIDYQVHNERGEVVYSDGIVLQDFI